MECISLNLKDKLNFFLSLKLMELLTSPIVHYGFILILGEKILKINRYVDMDTVEREAKKDYIDRHSPFISCANTAKKGEKFPVTVKIGSKYTHPGDYDHYIANIQLYSGDTLLACADFALETLEGQDEKGQAEVTFHLTPTRKKLNLVAHSYCTKHGIWESDPVVVSVSE